MDLPDAIIPLRQWIASERRTKASSHTTRLKNQSLLRTTTVAYAIVELLRRAEKSIPVSSNSSDYSIDNFVVRLSSTSWNNIAGASMISHALDVHIHEPSFLACDDAETKDSAQEDGMGMYFEAEITPSSTSSLPTGNGHGNGIANHQLDPAQEEASDIGRSGCKQFGLLLYELYSGSPPSPAAVTHNQDQLDIIMSCNESDFPAQKRAASVCNGSISQQQQSLKELGFPPSLSLFVQHLINGESLYPSLEAASNDIHLLLCDPECYLFDYQVSSVSPQLHIKEGKVYGREKEVALITDAFCRVSSGKSVALFIGGFSGSGKSTLVQSVTTRVDIAGGYVLTQKVDQMSERPLEAISAFNKLCLLIREKNSPEELAVIEKMLLIEFENDFSVLARLLPHIHLLCPQRSPQNLETREMGADQLMNSHNVNFVLQRFIRIVSSKEKPVVLFLDDLQWAASPDLDVIYAILSDTRGSSCFFFIGSYRDNEVEDDHPVYELMANLDLASVEIKQLKLSGLMSEDLNVMVSEFLCVLPRKCKSLSDIVFEKTEGNPFFALEFLMSLVSRRLLEYSLRDRKWIWDENKIRSENIADNVLYLLTDKMSYLPENVQFALKALSCFGIKTDEAIVGYLSSTTQYSDFSEWLSRAISERCIFKLGREFKFSHDKVREAAYSLIPDSKKRQFHHDIGMLLYSISKDDLDGAVMFQIVDQINYDLSLAKPSMRLDITKLNVRAGLAAMDLSDFATAHSYTTKALSLLPKDHWNSHYEFSLELFFLRAKAAYSSGNIEEAKQALTQMIEERRCIDDPHILDAYHCYINILHYSEEREKAIISCRKILSELNESVPNDIVNGNEMDSIAKATGLSLSKMSDEDWYKMKAIPPNHHNIYIIKFYSALTNICFQYKARLMPWLTCRMVNFTLEHGICSDSLVALIQHAAMFCRASITNVEGAYRLGRVVLNLSKKFNSLEMVPQIYFCQYGFIAQHIEPIQSCTQMLRKAFEVGMSTGESAVAFNNAIILIRFGLLSGEKLPSLIKETDYYIELANRFNHKVSQVFFFIYREVISKLMDKSTSSSEGSAESPADELISSAAYLKAHYLYRMLISFWQGSSQRCQHFVEKLLQMKPLGGHNEVFVMFYGALNTFRIMKSKKESQSRNSKVRKTYKNALNVLMTAQSFSTWNYSNKIRLLEAEKHSFEKKNEAAKAAYNAAITLSQSSNFIHEMGYAAESAAIHFKKIGQREDAINYFKQAKECYTEWGSQMKVDFISRQLEMAQNSMA